MSRAAPGRHRSVEPRPTSAAPRVAVAAGLLLALALISGAGWWYANRTSDETSSAVADDGRPSTSATVATPDDPTVAVVDTRRTVTVVGDVVTVAETTSVASGAGVRAVPTSTAPLGLELLSRSILGADGRSTSFDRPVRMPSTGTLSVRARYRLTRCPEVLPVLWPSPVRFPAATRTFTLLDEPLHTAQAICPGTSSRAHPLPGLSGRVIHGTTVRFHWSGTPTLTIVAVGSTSGVATVVADPRCHRHCVARLPRKGSTHLTLQRVDPCPPADTDDSMVLVTSGLGSTRRLALVDVPRIHRSFCR